MPDRKFCAIDAEGDVGNMGLLGVAFYSDIAQCYLTDHNEIILLLQRHAEEGYTFLAHNAQYDMSVIFWQLRIPMRAIYYNGRFNRGEWRYDKKMAMCQLWDTLALSGGISLSRLGDALGLPKYATPQRLLGKDPDKWLWRCSTHDRWECEDCYAVRDAHICYKFMTDLTATLAAWGIKPHRRISGLAMQTWRVLDNPSDIHIADKRIRSLSRDAYHGGRCETFKLGALSPLYSADVCSMYPSIMASTAYPDPSTLIYLDAPDASSVPLECEGVAECDISIPQMYVPPLPYVHRGQLHYPIGRVRGSWTLGEIRYAVSLGCRVNKWYRVAYAQNTLYPFNNFIATLWRMREEYERIGDPRALFAKLLMNNLYGRLGMRDDLQRKDIYLAEPNSTIKGQPHNSWHTMDGQLYLEYERDQPIRRDWVNVMWAAQTTSYARIKLHRYLVMQGSSLVYCDTDSVFSMSPIVGLGEGLGQLRDEQVYTEAVIAAPKMYALRRTDGEWQAKAKGIPRHVALYFLEHGEADYSQPIRPTSQATRKIKAGTWVPVHKESQRALARRTPVDPSVITAGAGWSDTLPPVVGPLP